MSDLDKITRTDIILNGTTATYSFSHQSLIQGSYIGQFVFKCFLLPMERLAAAREKRALLGDHELYATSDEKWLAWALTELKYRIISAPPFWTQNEGIAGNLPDEDFISKVISAAMDSEAMYVKHKKEERERLLSASMKSAEAFVNQKNEEDKERKEKKNKDEDDLDDIEDEILD